MVARAINPILRVNGENGLASDGTLHERYEYTPYGERTVYKRAGSADGKTSAPLYESQRVEVASVRQPYGLCDFGHQGLALDKEFGQYYNRNRYYDPRAARFLNRDPVGYVDGMSLYEYCRSGPVGATDAMGLRPMGPQDPGYQPGYEKLPWKDVITGTEKKCPGGGGGGGDGVPAREQPPIPPWKPPNEGPVRGGGGGGGGDDEFSWWGTFVSALGQELAGRAEGMVMGLNPGTWVEGGIRDYEAGIRRGQSGFDAALDAIARNTPGLNVGTGVAEAIKGTHLGGPLHGQPLQWYDRTGRVGNLLTYEAACGLGYCAAKGYNPTLGGSAPSSVTGDLQGAAQRAAETVGPGRGPVHGTKMHSAFRTEVNKLGKGNLATEVSYLKGKFVPRGTPGSVRLDVVEGSVTGPTAIYDLKTGSATLSPARIQQMQPNIPGGADVPINEVRP